VAYLRGIGALPCCPTENKLSCSTGSNSWCIGGDPSQPCDPGCLVSETITFGGDTSQAAAGTQAYLDALAAAVAGAPTSGGTPKKPAFNWALVGIAAIGAVVVVRSMR
jgi:hypothetical protein